jgi:hypothetical protein
VDREYEKLIFNLIENETDEENVQNEEYESFYMFTKFTSSTSEKISRDSFNNIISSGEDNS